MELERIKTNQQELNGIVEIRKNWKLLVDISRNSTELDEIGGNWDELEEIIWNSKNQQQLKRIIRNWMIFERIR